MPSPLFSIWLTLFSPFFTASLQLFFHNWEKWDFLCEMRPKCWPFHQFGPHADQVRNCRLLRKHCIRLFVCLPNHLIDVKQPLSLGSPGLVHRQTSLNRRLHHLQTRINRSVNQLQITPGVLEIACPLKLPHSFLLLQSLSELALPPVAMKWSKLIHIQTSQAFNTRELSYLWVNDTRRPSQGCTH